MSEFTKTMVIGGGAWGTALATVAARAGLETSLWARDPETVAAINDSNENPRHLPGIALDPNISATTDLAALKDADFALLVTPAQTTRAVAAQIAGHLRPGTPVVLCAKGLERGSAKRLSEVLGEVAPDAVPAVLSGPSFATDVARHLPTAVTIAAADPALSRRLAEALSHATFRPYASADLAGVEIGGALKNVLAIGAGIVAGRGLGASAQAALIARGFAELRRLAAAFGAAPETLTGLSGLGDLVLTCSQAQSRNFSFGLSLGRGAAVADLLAEGKALAEGAYTAAVAVEIAAARGIDLPISAAVEAVLTGRTTIDEATANLMRRPLKREG